MKISNRLLVAATVLVFAYLVVFDLGLRAEYRKGNYKNRFYHMNYKALNHFTKIEQRAGNVLDLRIEKGSKFGIWMDDYFKDKIVVKQLNGTLYIDYVDRAHFNNRPSGIIVTCPFVNSIVTIPLITPETSLWSVGRTTVTGFKQDAMAVSADKQTEIILTHNQLNKLNAGTTASKATVTVNDDNQINDASFKILGRSELKLYQTIKKSDYNYTDSATITLNGKSMRGMQQH